MFGIVHCTGCFYLMSHLLRHPARLFRYPVAGQKFTRKYVAENKEKNGARADYVLLRFWDRQSGWGRRKRIAHYFCGSLGTLSADGAAMLVVRITRETTEGAVK